MRRVLLLVLLASFAVPVAAQNCDTALEDAGEQYRAGYFDEAIELLTNCLERNAFDAGERRRVYRLLGLSYIGKDREQDARAAVRALLEVAPDYQPDPALDPPPFVALVEEMNRNVPAPPVEPSESTPTRFVSQTEGFMGALDIGGTSYSDDVDGSASGPGIDLTLGYGFTPALAAYLQLGGASFSDFSDIGEASITNAGVGARYHLGGGQKKLVPFLGGGVFYQSLSIDFDVVSGDGAFIGGGEADFSGVGGGGEAGILYFFSPALAVEAGARVLFSSLSRDDVDVDISTTTFDIGVGVSWSLGAR